MLVDRESNRNFIYLVFESFFKIFFFSSSLCNIEIQKSSAVWMARCVVVGGLRTRCLGCLQCSSVHGP